MKNISPFFLQAPTIVHCGEPETEVGAKFHMHQAGQRSLNEYEKLRQAAEGWN